MSMILFGEPFMLDDNIDEIILRQVNNRSGVKGVELATVVADSARELAVDFDTFDFVKTVERLVKEGEIVELEFTLPTMPDRIKSIYFPKGTEIIK